MRMCGIISRNQARRRAIIRDATWESGFLKFKRSQRAKCNNEVCIYVCTCLCVCMCGSVLFQYEIFARTRGRRAGFRSHLEKRNSPSQDAYSHNTAIKLSVSFSTVGLFWYWVKGKTRFPLRLSDPMTRHSVNITLCRTIKYSAALLRQTFNRGCRLYLFVCDESFSPLNGTPSVYTTCRYA